jgi:hypothetical protein
MTSDKTGKVTGRRCRDCRKAIAWHKDADLNTLLRCFDCSVTHRAKLRKVK